MTKKIISLILVCILSVMSLSALTACSEGGSGDIKIGCILIGDSTEGYTEAHMNGIKAACDALGIDHTSEDNVIWKYFVQESEEAAETARDLVAQGCNLIISNSYGHQDYMALVAKEYPNVQFVAMTGDKAKALGLENLSNAFTEVYESRYVSGVVAGLKLKELADAGKIADTSKDENGNIKIGYVGAYPYAEVVSGYTAFFLGIQSIMSNVVMDVQYTFEWYDFDLEKEAAELLIERGCVIIGQHADSTGAPTATQAARKDGKEVYSVGYNIDMTDIGDAVLTSATNNWEVCYKYMIDAVMKGEDIATNWTGGYAENAVATTKLGSLAAAGSQDKIDETVNAIKAGTLHVFDVSKFTVGGEHITSAFATDTDGDFVQDADNAVFDGYYHESHFQSAPSFTLRIDGITELNPNQN